MQCKDIPDLAVLRFLAIHNDGQDPRWCNLGFADVRDVRNAMPDGVSWKLALAKMRMLERRGLILGCTCGCRGDFHLSLKGRQLLNDPAHMVPKRDWGFEAPIVRKDITPTRQSGT